MDLDDEFWSLKIYRLLPGKDCGEKSPCGLPKCRLLAKAILRDEKKPEACKYLSNEYKNMILMVLDDYFH